METIRPGGGLLAIFIEQVRRIERGVEIGASNGLAGPVREFVSREQMPFTRDGKPIDVVFKVSPELFAEWQEVTSDETIYDENGELTENIVLLEDTDYSVTEVPMVSSRRRHIRGMPLVEPHEGRDDILKDFLSMTNRRPARSFDDFRVKGRAKDASFEPVREVGRRVPSTYRLRG